MDSTNQNGASASTDASTFLRNLEPFNSQDCGNQDHPRARAEIHAINYTQVVQALPAYEMPMVEMLVQRYHNSPVSSDDNASTLWHDKKALTSRCHGDLDCLKAGVKLHTFNGTPAVRPLWDLKVKLTTAALML
jgi:hypothetical protein